MPSLRKPDEGFCVYYLGPVTPKRAVSKKYTWFARTSEHPVTEFEMAQSLTRDLTRLGVAWQIRDARGNVVEENIPENLSCVEVL